MIRPLEYRLPTAAPGGPTVAREMAVTLGRRVCAEGIFHGRLDVGQPFRIGVELTDFDELRP